MTPRAQGIEQAFADSPVQAALVSAAFDRVSGLGESVDHGDLKVTVEMVPLEEAGSALHAIASGSVTGKLVIAVRM